MNIRKESLRFIRAPVDYCKPRLIEGDQRDVELGKNTPFNLEFTFDCDVPCSITIYYFCTEEYTGSGVMYVYFFKICLKSLTSFNGSNKVCT